jgi:hypothetical protein
MRNLHARLERLEQRVRAAQGCHCTTVVWEGEVAPPNCPHDRALVHGGARPVRRRPDPCLRAGRGRRRAGARQGVENESNHGQYEGTSPGRTV